MAARAGPEITGMNHWAVGNVKVGLKGIEPGRRVFDIQ